jgi:hypothetical protein
MGSELFVLVDLSLLDLVLQDNVLQNKVRIPSKAVGELAHQRRSQEY